MLNKICTRTAKSAPYPPCTVTVYWLKYRDPARCCRRVTQPPFIAGPLVVMLGAAQSLILTLYNIICVTRQIQNTRQSVNLDKIKINNSCTQIATDFKKLCAFTNICNSETGTTTLTRTV